MTEDLMAKEKEFHRLNEELEEKTQELMKEVDSIMDLTDNSHFSSLNQHYSFINSKDMNKKFFDAPTLMERQSESPLLREKICLPHFYNQSEFLKENTKLENFDDFPTKYENSSKTETMIKLLKSKIKSEQNEIQAIRTEYEKKCNYCKELEVESKKQAETKEKLENQICSLKDSILRHETGNGNLQKRIQEQDVEAAILKKEIEDMRKELKISNQQNVSTAVRLNRTLEDNKKLRNSAKFSKLEEKDLRDQIRKISEEKRLAIKNLEKQRLELYQAYKKQILLVDNLKKQKAYLEASRQVQITEENFTKLLEWKPE